MHTIYMPSVLISLIYICNCVSCYSQLSRLGNSAFNSISVIVYLASHNCLSSTTPPSFHLRDSRYGYDKGNDCKAESRSK
ncbi:hypothetical protein QVD17_20297 [Tagetes erecta]|uniref:Secreted protein n=1 Tax=Tagetes erecta TaxID=13708 RepID=A0AAD8KPD3_TARER|nr:hypothetical protein QVD17_20297 [Tagetes erecta]